MKRYEFGVQFAWAVVVCGACVFSTVADAASDVPEEIAKPVAPKAMQIGGVLTGQLNAMRSRDAKGKRIDIYQLVSEPRRLPAPAGLCNLETGPETFEIVAADNTQAVQLKKLVGKEVAFKVGAIACAEQAGQMSEALVTKWQLMGKTN